MSNATTSFWKHLAGGHNQQSHGNRGGVSATTAGATVAENISAFEARERGSEARRIALAEAKTLLAKHGVAITATYGIAPRRIKEIAEVYDELITAYPEVTDTLHTIEIGGRQHPYAEYNSDTRKITFYGKYLMDEAMLGSKVDSEGWPTALENSFAKNVAEGLHPPTDVSPLRTIATHEFAHALHSLNNIYDDSRKGVDTRMFRQESRRTLSRGLSSYALQSEREFFAEAFAEYKTYKTPRRIAQHIGSTFDQWYKSYSSSIRKHLAGQHDQLSHGNRAGGSLAATEGVAVVGGQVATDLPRGHQRVNELRRLTDEGMARFKNRLDGDRLNIKWMNLRGSIDPRAVQDAYDELDKLIADFPEVGNEIGMLGIDPMNFRLNGIVATNWPRRERSLMIMEATNKLETDAGQPPPYDVAQLDLLDEINSIVIHPELANDYVSLQNKIGDAHERGFGVAENFRDSVTHEFAHSITAYMERVENRPAGSKLKDFEWMHQLGERLHGFLGPPGTTYDRSRPWKFDAGKIQKLSFYAGRNANEFIAESWTAYRKGSRKRTPQIVGKYIDEWYRAHRLARGMTGLRKNFWSEVSKHGSHNQLTHGHRGNVVGQDAFERALQSATVTMPDGQSWTLDELLVGGALQLNKFWDFVTRRKVKKHLAGQHDQMAHGNRGGGVGLLERKPNLTRFNKVYAKYGIKDPKDIVPHDGGGSWMIGPDGKTLGVNGYARHQSMIDDTFGWENSISEYDFFRESHTIRLSSSMMSKELNISIRSTPTKAQRRAMSDILDEGYWNDVMVERISFDSDYSEDDSSSFTGPRLNSQLREQLNDWYGVAKSAFWKHLMGQHDQSTHGSWATGIGTVLEENTRESPFLSEWDEGTGARLAGVLSAKHKAFRDMSPDQVMDKLVENNLAVYERAKAQMSPEEFNAAKDWYANRHTEAHAAAERLGVDPDVYLGVAAVLSAQGDWDTHGKRLGTYDSTNLQIETLLSDPRFADKAIPALDLIDQLPNTPSANGQAREKIIELYRGGNPNDIVSGWKVRNFYNNLSAPDIDSGYTMDRHAIRQALNDSTLPEVAPGGGMTLGKLLGRPGRRKDGSITAQSYLYPLLADAGWRAARRARIRPHEFQAVTWVQWRKENPGKRR